MRNISYVLISTALLFLVSACEKDKTEFKSTANVYAVNAVVGGTSVKMNIGATSAFSYAKAPDLAYGATNVNGAYTGNNMISIVSSADTTNSLFKGNLTLESINSLYISGQSPTIDTMFRVERNFPYVQYANINPDNSLYLRFVNLSPNSPAVNVNIKSSATNEVSALVYRGISDFKKYAALTTTPDYIFEVRNASTNALLTTYTLSIANNRYKTVSLILRGLVGTTTGTSAYAVTSLVYN